MDDATHGEFYEALIPHSEGRECLVQHIFHESSRKARQASSRGNKGSIGTIGGHILAQP